VRARYLFNSAFGVSVDAVYINNIYKKCVFVSLSLSSELSVVGSSAPLLLLSFFTKKKRVVHHMYMI